MGIGWGNRPCSIQYDDDQQPDAAVSDFHFTTIKAEPAQYKFLIHSSTPIFANLKSSGRQAQGLCASQLDVDQRAFRRAVTPNPTPINPTRKLNQISQSIRPLSCCADCTMGNCSVSAGRNFPRSTSSL